MVYNAAPCVFMASVTVTIVVFHGELEMEYSVLRIRQDVNMNISIRIENMSIMTNI